MDRAEGAPYEGPERRRHRVLITQNREYHFRDRVCVAVRDRASRRWLGEHSALRRTLTGAVAFGPEARLVEGEPCVGQALFFADGGAELLTTVLASIERPTRRTVAAYASLAPSA